eukprot:3079724-Pyramimonas_sp.AAC.1
MEGARRSLRTSGTVRALSRKRSGLYILTKTSLSFFWRAVLCPPAEGDGGRGALGGGAEGAQDHAHAPQGEERDAPPAQVRAAPAHGQGARVRPRRALQPDPAAAHVAHAGGPGAPLAGQGV